MGGLVLGLLGVMIVMRISLEGVVLDIKEMFVDREVGNVNHEVLIGINDLGRSMNELPPSFLPINAHLSGLHTGIDSPPSRLLLTQHARTSPPDTP